MSSSKKLNVYRDFAAGVYLCIQYTYSHKERGKEGRVEPKTRLQQVTKLDRNSVPT